MLVTGLVAAWGGDKVLERTRRRCAQAHFYGWMALMAFTYICIIVQLDCAGRGACGSFGTSYFYALFVLNRSYSTVGQSIPPEAVVRMIECLICAATVNRV